MLHWDLLAGLAILSSLFGTLWLFFTARKSLDGVAHKSRLFYSYTRHTRFHPVQHGFRYEVWYLCVDVKELEGMGSWLFGHNQWRPFAIYDKDYLGPAEKRITVKLKEYLTLMGRPTDKIHRVELVTVPRYFGYGFNPVSFFYCYDKDETISVIVLQVNNTFGETHLYILDDATRMPKTRAGFHSSYLVGRSFHVSPFNDVTGDYEIHCSDIRTSLDVTIVMFKENQRKHMMATLRGTSTPLTTENLLWTAISFPLTAFVVLPRITWEAGKLAFKKGLRVFARPNPKGTTITHLPPTATEQLSIDLVAPVLERKCESMSARLSFVLPSFEGRDTLEFGVKGGAKEVIMVRLRNYSFFWSLAKCDGAGALAMSYMDGSWECSQLPELLRLLFHHPNQQSQEQHRKNAGALFRLLRWLRQDDTARASVDQVGLVDGGPVLEPVVSDRHAEIGRQIATALSPSAKILVVGLRADVHGVVSQCGSGRKVQVASDCKQLSSLEQDFDMTVIIEGLEFPTREDLGHLLQHLHPNGKLLVALLPDKSGNFTPSPPLIVDNAGTEGGQSGVVAILPLLKALVIERLEERYFSAITNFVVSPFELPRRHAHYLRHLSSDFVPGSTSKLASELQQMTQGWLGVEHTVSPEIEKVWEELRLPALSSENTEDCIGKYCQVEFKRATQFYRALRVALCCPVSAQYFLELTKPC